MALDQAFFIIIKDLLVEISLCQNINWMLLAQFPDHQERLIKLYDLQWFVGDNTFKYMKAT